MTDQSKRSAVVGVVYGIIDEGIPVVQWTMGPPLSTYPESLYSEYANTADDQRPSDHDNNN